MSKPARKVEHNSQQVLHENIAAALTPRVRSNVKHFAYRRYLMLKYAGVMVDEGFANQIYTDVVTDTTIGRLTWHPDRVKLSTHLCGAIKSRTHQMLLRHQRHEHISLSGQQQDVLDFEPTESAIEAEASLAVGGDPSTAYADGDERKRVWDALRAESQRRGDRVALLVLDAVESGYGARRDMPDLGVTRREYDAAWKRLRRLAAELGLVDILQR